jgi:hypothetical protein
MHHSFGKTDGSSLNFWRERYMNLSSSGREMRISKKRQRG